MQGFGAELRSCPPDSKASPLGGANAAQREAIAHRAGPMLVLAGPGSGKTFVITRRIQFLVEQYGVDPATILVITFTKAAAIQMQRRFSGNTGERYGEVRFGTFHSVFFSILRKHRHYSLENLITPTQQRMYMKQVILHTDYGLSADLDTIDALLAAVSRRKNLGTAGDGADMPLAPWQFEEVYEAYREQMEWNRKIDFDDMLLDCGKLLAENPGACAYWQGQFRHILVDEFQDINPLQYEILRRLARPQDNLFAVGDDDQAIYGFRGSRPEILLHFPEEYPEARTVTLSCNYRSGNAIVDAANLVIRENRVRFTKKLTAQRQGGRVRLLRFDAPQEEQRTLVRYLQRAAKSGQDCALLCRTNRELEAWARLCEDAGVRFRQQTRRKSVWQEEYGRDLLAYLKAAIGKADREELLRLLNRPMRCLSRECLGDGASLENALKFYENNSQMRQTVRKLTSDLHRIGGMQPFLAVSYLCRGIGYEGWLLEQCPDADRRRQMREGLERCRREAAGYHSLADFLEAVQDAPESADGRRKEQSAERGEEEAVSLMTYHASKGLEFHTVFLPGLNDGKVPRGQNLTAQETEEERRMFYVAMTRAKEMLILSYSASSEGASPVRSPFLRPFLGGDSTI